jgi:hypothetical protein
MIVGATEKSGIEPLWATPKIADLPLVHFSKTHALCIYSWCFLMQSTLTLVTAKGNRTLISDLQDRRSTTEL